MIRYIIVGPPVYVTIFWSIIFLFQGTNQNRAKHALGFFMLTASILYTCHAVYFLKFFDLYQQVDALYLSASLSVYPMFYIYIKLLTCETHYRLFNLLHFTAPVILGIMLEILHLLAPEQQLAIYLKSTLIGNNWGSVLYSGHAGWLARVYFASRLVFAAQVVYYLIKGYKLVNKHNKRLANFYSELKDRKLAWVKLLTVTLMITSVASSVSNLLGRDAFAANTYSLLAVSATFSILLFVIGLQGNRQNSTVRDMVIDEQHADNMPTCKLDEMSKTMRESVREKLNRIIKDEKIYLQQDIRITSLCKKLNADRLFIVSLIEEEYGENFNSFINRHRIGHAKQLMRQQQLPFRQKIDRIAAEAGFVSTSAFTKAFKEIGGTDLYKYTNSRTLP